MKNIKMWIQYDGSRYRGWQRLKGVENTIQGKLETVLSLMTEHPVEIIGAGRTDAGVHAKGQIANFKTNSTLSEIEMLTYLNQYLPTDIVVYRMEKKEERFHSRFNAIEKKYTYRVWNHWIPSAFDRKYSYHVAESLNLPAMEAAAKKFLGSHEFVGFSSVKKSNKPTVRSIKEITFRKEGSLLEISLIGDGFLHNMVRIMVGTLLEIGMGKKGQEIIPQIFRERKRESAGVTVPAHGLFLEEIYYDESN